MNLLSFECFSVNTNPLPALSHHSSVNNPLIFSVILVPSGPASHLAPARSAASQLGYKNQFFAHGIQVFILVVMNKGNCIAVRTPFRDRLEYLPADNTSYNLAQTDLRPAQVHVRFQIIPAPSKRIRFRCTPLTPYQICSRHVVVELETRQCPDLNPS